MLDYFDFLYYQNIFHEVQDTISARGLQIPIHIPLIERQIVAYYLIHLAIHLQGVIDLVEPHQNSQLQKILMSKMDTFYSLESIQN